MVSVVIPTYNRASFVSEAIGSVLAQTYPCFELVVVDDGSTDDTPDVVSNVKDPRMRYICQENLGAPAARNRGWRESTGRYLLFLDDDDRLHREALEALVGCAAEAPHAGLIGAGYQYVDGAGNLLGVAEPWKVTNKLDLETWVVYCPFIPSATLARRDWLDRVGGFDLKQEAAQDWDLWLRLAAESCPMQWLERPVGDYRLHGEGVSGDVQRQLKGSIRALEKVFSRTDLPAEVVGRRGEAHAGVHLYAAARAYSAKDIDDAQEHLSVAAGLVPAWVDSGILLERVLRLGGSPIVAREPQAYAVTVLGNLPPGLFSARSRRRAQARVAAAQLFSDYRDCRWSPIRSLWWRAARNDPTWLANRGFVLIGLRALLRIRS